MRKYESQQDLIFFKKNAIPSNIPSFFFIVTIPSNQLSAIGDGFVVEGEGALAASRIRANQRVPTHGSEGERGAALGRQVGAAAQTEIEKNFISGGSMGIKRGIG